MNSRNKILINIGFIGLFIVFLVLSLTIDYFFFLPIFCFLPFTFSKSFGPKEKSNLQREIGKINERNIRKCPKCEGIITEPLARYCYFCGSKLKEE